MRFISKKLVEKKQEVIYENEIVVAAHPGHHLHRRLPQQTDVRPAAGWRDREVDR
jgi:hypothetical protein